MAGTRFCRAVQENGVDPIFFDGILPSYWQGAPPTAESLPERIVRDSRRFFRIYYRVFFVSENSGRFQ